MNIIPQTKDSASYNKNTSGSILLAGESSRKEEVLRIIPLRDKENHNKGKIHLHDLEYYDLTYNCIGLNVSHILGKHPYSFSQALRQIVREVIALTNSQSGGIGFLNFDSDMAKYIREESEEEITESFRECFSDLNCPLRRGSEKAYVTFNFGLDTSPSGRKCSRGLLNAYKLGDCLGRPFQFPNLVFKVKKNINLEEGAPNHDLYLHALKTTGQCMIPTYFNCDSSTNRSAPAENIGIMGCRTRVVDNIYGEKGGIRRGNVAAVTINLVQLAFRANGNTTVFERLLGESMNEAKNVLLHRLMILQKKGDFPYLYSKNLYVDANTGDPEKMLRNGTLAVGFIGLWDALSVLKNQTWTDIESMRPFFHEALEIVKFMRNRVDRYLSTLRQNFSLLA
ncbi:MAG: hypothetical protein IJX22_06920, partial [Opitutales bacterium]|nr:hypothetical protein [Opitutales bacterium]